MPSEVIGIYRERQGQCLYFETEERGTIILVLGSIQMMSCPANFKLDEPGQKVRIPWVNGGAYCGWAFGGVVEED